MLTVTRRTRGQKEQGGCDIVERTSVIRVASQQADAPRKAWRTEKVRACACTNTWTREAYNLGALGVVINIKTASTLVPGVASPATHAREPRSAPGNV